MPLNWAAVIDNVESGRFLICEGADKSHICRKFRDSAKISILQCEFINMLLDLDMNVLCINLTDSTMIN